MPAIGMGDTAYLIAVELIQNANLEHQIVDDEEKHTPFDKGEIESLDAFLNEGSFVLQIFQREEIACCDEEEWHVELEDKLA